MRWIYFGLLVGCVTDAPIVNDGGGDGSSNGDSAMMDSGTKDSLPGDEDDGTTAFTPASFGSDLALWVIGDKTVDVGGKVATWTDQSPHKTDLVQTDDPSRPLHEKGVLNGHDVIDFNGTGVVLGVDASDGGTPANLSLGQADDYAIASVLSVSANGVPGGYAWFKAQIGACIGSCTVKDGLRFGGDVTSSQDDSASMRQTSADGWLTATSSPLKDHGYHVVIARRIGETKIQLRTDTVPKEQTIPGYDVSRPDQPLLVGAVQLGTFMGSFAFRVAEIAVVHRAGNKPISDNDIVALEAYLKNKYKTP